MRIEQRAGGSTVFYASTSVSKPCAVYLIRALELGLVYVGIADDFEARWRQHRRSSWWLGEVVVESIDVYWMTCREDARQMEAAIINREHPRYNTSLEKAAFKRYQAAAGSENTEPWPVAICEAYSADGDLIWADR